MSPIGSHVCERMADEQAKGQRADAAHWLVLLDDLPCIAQRNRSHDGLREAHSRTGDARKPTPASGGDKHFCSFCGRGQDKVGTLVVEHDGCAAICNECVDVCVDVIAKQKAAPPPAMTA